MNSPNLDAHGYKSFCLSPPLVSMKAIYSEYVVYLWKCVVWRISVTFLVFSSAVARVFYYVLTVFFLGHYYFLSLLCVTARRWFNYKSRFRCFRKGAMEGFIALHLQMLRNFEAFVFIKDCFISSPLFPAQDYAFCWHVASQSVRKTRSPLFCLCWCARDAFNKDVEWREK